MTKTDELRKKMAAKKAEIENLQKENKIEDAVKAADELKVLNQQFQVEKALEDATFENFLKHKELVTPTNDTKLRNRAFNKLVLNPLRTFPEPLTDEEKNAYLNLSGTPGQPALIEGIDTQGGYLVPSEQMTTLQEIRKKFIALKDYVTVVNTKFTSGRWPVYTQQNLTVHTLKEMSEIPEGTVSFTEATYTVEDHLLLLPVSNQLIADSSIDIVSFMGEQIAFAFVDKENKKIIEQFQTLIAEATKITTYKALDTALFKTLDGVYFNEAKIFTNQNGFLWLKHIDDANNRPLFEPNPTEKARFMYCGKDIVVVPDSILPDETANNKKYAPFLIGDMHSYITMFERQGLELSTSKEIYFRFNGLGMRGIERFGIVVTDPNAMTALKVEL